MNPSVPPPLPHNRRSLNGRIKLLIGVALVPATISGTLLLLRICGLIRLFSMPTGGMTPAVSAGDHVMMETMTYLAHEPHRGDVVVFKSDGIALLPPATIYVERVAGEPGDHLRISDGQLYINDKLTTLSNATGKINYLSPQFPGTPTLQTNVTVPEGCYFVLGDNSTNSFDSRYWGNLPRANIMGRIKFCYWPPQRTGFVK